MAAWASPDVSLIRGQWGMVCVGPVAQWHFGIIETLRFLVSIDQLDPTALVSAGRLVRDRLRIETAVSRNAKQPDGMGLDVMISGAIRPQGGVDVPVISAWVSGTQRDAANIPKLGRLPREERDHEDKRRIGWGKHVRQKGNGKDKKTPGEEG